MDRRLLYQRRWQQRDTRRSMLRTRGLSRTQGGTYIATDHDTGGGVDCKDTRTEPQRSPERAVAVGAARPRGAPRAQGEGRVHADQNQQISAPPPSEFIGSVSEAIILAKGNKPDRRHPGQSDTAQRQNLITYSPMQRGVAFCS